MKKGELFIQGPKIIGQLELQLKGVQVIQGQRVRRHRGFQSGKRGASGSYFGAQNVQTTVQYRGSAMFIPDPNFFLSRIKKIPGSRVKKITGSRIRIRIRTKNLSILTQKLFLSSRKCDPGCSFRIRILIFYPPRILGSKRHLIPDPDPQHCHGPLK